MRAMHNSISPYDIANRFGTHAPTDGGTAHRNLYAFFTNVANILASSIPESREKSIAIERLEEVSMWAHKALAQADPLVREKYPDVLKEK